MLLAESGSGKTTLIKNLLFHLKSGIYDFDNVMLETNMRK